MQNRIRKNGSNRTFDIIVKFLAYFIIHTYIYIHTHTRIYIHARLVNIILHIVTFSFKPTINVF